MRWWTVPFHSSLLNSPPQLHYSPPSMSFLHVPLFTPAHCFPLHPRPFCSLFIPAPFALSSSPPFCSLFIPTPLLSLHPHPFALSSSPPLCSLFIPAPLLSLHPRPLCPSPRMSAADLAGLVSRLETVTTRLEAVAARGGGGGAGVCGRGGKGKGDHVCEGRDVRGCMWEGWCVREGGCEGR